MPVDFGADTPPPPAPPSELPHVGGRSAAWTPPLRPPSGTQANDPRPFPSQAPIDLASFDLLLRPPPPPPAPDGVKAWAAAPEVKAAATAAGVEHPMLLLDQWHALPEAGRPDFYRWAGQQIAPPAPEPPTWGGLRVTSSAPDPTVIRDFTGAIRLPRL